MSDILVALATYNRSRDLERTLESFSRTDRAGLDVVFAVADNGSTDDTRRVIESFAGRMNVQYRFEPRSGKNRALNTILETVTLGDIVVFTDDDVDVPRDWLTAIRSASDRWPGHSVFGGRIDVVFPPVPLPAWKDDAIVAELVFARHDYADHECEYRADKTPFGPVFWVRKEIFANGLRFNEAIGPRPKNRIMGSEISFLTSLKNNGYKIVYSPAVSVGHRVQEDVLNFSSVWKRAYRWGRGRVNIFGLPRQDLLKNSPAAWRLGQYAMIARSALKVLSGVIRSSRRTRPVKTMKHVMDIGYHVEALSISKEEKQPAA